MGGNYRFRLSDMMPNAWFYKLKDMSSSRSRKCSNPSQKKKLPTPTPTTKSCTIISQKPYVSDDQPRYYSYHITTTQPNIPHKLLSANSPINPKVSDTHFPDHYYSPRLVSSSTRKSKRKSMYKPSPATTLVSAGCRCHATFNSVWTKPAHTTHQYEDYYYSTVSSSTELYEPDTAAAASSDPFDDDRLAASCCASCNCRVTSSSTNDNDIIIDMDDKSFTRKIDKFEDLDTISDLQLPPILTKPQPPKFKTTEVTQITTTKTTSSKLEETPLSIKIVKAGRIKAKKKEPNSNPVLPRKSSSTTTTSTTGIKLRTNTPRVASRKIQGYGSRKSISSTTTTTSTKKSRSRKFWESFAIVKSSNDPEREFRESMMEMIIENNIRASKDLEELLACYLLLNSNEYHDLIVKAFEQIWFDMTQRRI